MVSEETLLELETSLTGRLSSSQTTGTGSPPSFVPIHPVTIVVWSSPHIESR